MKQLHEFVIPKIYVQWKNVANCLSNEVADGTSDSEKSANSSSDSEEIADGSSDSTDTTEIIDTRKTTDKYWMSDDYPMQSCEDMLRDWLCTHNSVNPHTWETLINSIKQVEQLKAPAMEIENDVKKLIR